MEKRKEARKLAGENLSYVLCKKLTYLLLMIFFVILFGVSLVMAIRFDTLLARLAPC